MNNNTGRKQEEKVQDHETPVPKDDDVFLFDPWDEQFKGDFKPPQNEFEF